MELGEKLRQARLEAGLSQRQLCGEEITRNMLSLIENGSAKPSMKTLSYLAQKLGKPLSFFLDENAGEKQQFGEIWQQLNRAEEALEQGRTEYVRELLEKAESPVPELNRKKLLLLSRLPGADPTEIAGNLPSLDEELLLRARGALAKGKTDRGICLLMAAENRESAVWNLLMGQLLLKKKEFEKAVEYLHLAEPEFSGETAPLLEICYRELGDYKKAYEYACKQKQ